MHFSYDVELPLGSWDCCKTGPMEPRAELLSPEALLVAMPQHTLSHSPCSLAIPWRLPALCRSAIWLSICIRCLSIRTAIRFAVWFWVTKSGSAAFLAALQGCTARDLGTLSVAGEHEEDPEDENPWASHGGRWAANSWRVKMIGFRKRKYTHTHILPVK